MKTQVMQIVRHFTTIALAAGLAFLLISTTAHSAHSDRHSFSFDQDRCLSASRSGDRWERYDGFYKQTGSIMYRDEYVNVAGTMVPTRFRVVRIEPDGSKTEF